MYTTKQQKKSVTRQTNSCVKRKKVFDDANGMFSLQRKRLEQLNTPIQLWEPTYRKFEKDPIDEEIVIYLINETGSWHGHTVLAAEGWNKDGYGSGSKWLNVWSFIPEDENATNKVFGGLYGAIKAKIDVRHNNGDYRISETREIGWSKKISNNEYKEMCDVIEEEIKRVNSGKVKYVAVGQPIGLLNGIFHWEWHDNCNSWANKVLRKAGIISSLWGLNYYLPSIPSLSSRIYKKEELCKKIS